jgi:hypothetical protein
MESGSLISRQRQNLTKAAIDQGASHILWLDSDMMFPADIIDSMLRHNLDIVACNYSTRTVPFKGVAYTKIGDWNSWLRPYTGQGKKLRAVEGVGMGCMLVNVDVFKNMPKPWYEVKYSEKYNDFIGEDFYFCENARQLGYKIIIDTELSNHLKHLGLVGMEMQNTLP